MKKNVLVFPCGSEIGLEIYKSINCSTHFNVYGGSSVCDHGGFVYNNYITEIPFIEDEGFIDAINDIIEKYQIDYIFPAHDSVVLKLAKESEKGNLKCGLVTSSARVCEIARSKKLTYQTLCDTIDTPKIFGSMADIRDNNWPVFLKPDVGQGSKGVVKANSATEAVFYIKQDPSLLILEFLPGKEYTIDCFTDYRGKLLFSEGRERKRISNGISVSSEYQKDNRFRDMAEKINKKINFNGAWFFQVKENFKNDLVLMEIAPRIAGTMGLSRCKGINLPLLSLFNIQGFDVELFENDYEIVIDRALANRYRHNIAYGHVYIDFDDTLVVDGLVNLQIIAFIFQCINENIKVYLLTRHSGLLSDRMSDLKLDGLFDEVIWIKNNDNKSNYIKFNDSILIDDSFKERKEVKSSLNIPVFDVHMVESLIK